MHVDVRVIAATHRDLPAMVASGQFREDLWYRIAVFPVHLPPLRERLNDIPALATHFALRAAKRLGLSALNPSAEDIQLLVSYAWPGNVRELSAVIERAAILGEGKRLDVARALGAAAVTSQPAPAGPETPVALADPGRGPPVRAVVSEPGRRHGPAHRGRAGANTRARRGTGWGGGHPPDQPPYAAVAHPQARNRLAPGATSGDRREID